MAKPGYAKQAFWIRLFFMLFYWYVLNVVVLVFGVLIIVVSVIKLGSSYQPLMLVGWLKSVGAFIRQTFEFLAYESEEKPFPFQPWPKVSSDEQS